MRKPNSTILYKKGNLYHIYNRGNDKNRIFRREKDYDNFVGIVRRYEKILDIIVLSYCLMPNHFHLILKLGDSKTDISKFMQRCMTSYVMYFNRRYGRVGHLFQGRFESRLLDGGKDLSNLVNYLKNNPIEAGLVSKKEGKYKWFYLRKVRSRSGLVG